MRPESPSAASPAQPTDVSEALAWRTWSAGVAEARERGAPILCLAESTWTTGAQRLALVLGREPETRDLAEGAFVPVLIDPLERPDVAARLRWAATVLTGTAGPPLLALLAPSGRPFLAYCSLWPEGRDPYPSLRSLLEAVASVGAESRDAVEHAADELETRADPAGRGVEGAGTASVAALLRAASDERFGGLRERPKHPRPALWWRALDEADDASVRSALLCSLDAMRRGGILDQLEGSFHRCSRDERWVVPHFEKLVPSNAGLAAVYARAASVLERPDLLDTAAGAAAFALAGLERATAALGADTEHYTWTPRQIHELLEPALVQAVGLHFNITRDDSPHVLFRALEVDAMGDYADEPAAVLAERLERGKAQLRAARWSRPAPAEQPMRAPAWVAQTLRWLDAAVPYGVDVDPAVLERHLDELLAGPFDPAHGYARDGAFWLEDQVAIASACLSAAASRPKVAGRAAELASVVLEAYVDPRDGALRDRPGAEPPSLDVVDHALSAAIPTFLDVLRRLASGVLDDGPGALQGRFASAAMRIEHAHRAALVAALPGHD